MNRTWMMVGVVVVLGACGPANPPSDGGVDAGQDAGACAPGTVQFLPIPQGGGDGATTAEEAIVGLPYRTWAHPHIPACADTSQEQVEVSVAPAEPTLDAGTPLTTGAAEVTMVPSVPGMHDVDVRFEPGLARGLHRVQVAANRLDAGVIVEILPWDLSTCAGLPRRTRSGLVLCEQAGNILLWESGRDAGAFPGTALAVVGDVVWSNAPDSAVERRRVLDGGLVLEGRVVVHGLSIGDHYSDEDVSLRLGAEVHELRWIDGGLEDVARTDGGITLLPDAGLASLVLADGDVWLLRQVDRCRVSPPGPCTLTGQVLGFVNGAPLAADVGPLPAYGFPDVTVRSLDRDAGLPLSYGWTAVASEGPVEGEALPYLWRQSEAYAAHFIYVTPVEREGAGLQASAYPERIGGYPYNPATPPRAVRINRDWILVGGPGPSEAHWLRR